MTPLLITALAVSAACGIFFAFLSARAVVEGRWPYLLVYVPGAVVFAIPAIVQFTRGERDCSALREFVAEHGGGQIRIQRDLRSTLRTVGFLLLLTVGCWAFSVGVWTDALVFDLSGRRGHAIPVMIAVIGLIAVCMVVAILVRGTSGWLALSPAGIDSMDLGLTRHRIPWADIDELTLAPQQRKKRQQVYFPDRLWLIRSGVGKRPLSLSINWPMGNRAAFWLIHFYWSHPELRDELADDRVVERIAAGRILDEVA
jgi:hypothetical protein